MVECIAGHIKARNIFSNVLSEELWDRWQSNFRTQHSAPKLFNELLTSR